jgi:hypothetical protein
VSRPLPSCNRSILTEIYLSINIEGANGRAGSHAYIQLVVYHTAAVGAPPTLGGERVLRVCTMRCELTDSLESYVSRALSYRGRRTSFLGNDCQTAVGLEGRWDGLMRVGGVAGPLGQRAHYRSDAGQALHAAGTQA